jgi:hypothetical protein
MSLSVRARSVAVFAGVAAVVAASACGDGTTAPIVTGDVVQLTAAQLGSLDSTGVVIVGANPGNFDLEALVDSTFDVLTAGIQARRVNITTDLTSSPLLFVGVHRVFTHANGTNNFATWTAIGIDDPAHLANLVEVGGFNINGTGKAPESVSGTIADGSGRVNALFLQIGASGSVTEWNANGGTVSFTSDSSATGAACPNFSPTALITCTIETMHVHFSATASSGSGGAGARQASLPADVDVPTMRLNYRTP